MATWASTRRHDAPLRSKARPAWAVALALGAVLAVVIGARAVRADTSARIVDAPRPVEQWGYAPAVISIQPGEWVSWSNEGGDVHNVVAVDGSFISDDLAPSEGFSWFFDTPGTFDYFCNLHEWMQGRVVVGSGSAPEPPPAEEADV